MRGKRVDAAGWAARGGDGVPDLTRSTAGVAAAGDRGDRPLADHPLADQVEVLEAVVAVAGCADPALDTTLAAVAHHAASALSCERAGIYLHGDEGDLALRYLHATDGRTAGSGRAVAAHVLRRREAMLVADTATSDVLAGPWHHDQGAVSVLGLPLEVDGRDIGVLILAHTTAHPRPFTPLCRRIGTAMAQQAALVIEHARRFEAEQEKVQRLRELDMRKTDWVDGITHDLRSPLTALTGFVETLRQFGDSVSEEERLRWLATIARQAEQMTGMVGDLLLASRIDRAGLDPGAEERLGLVSLVEEAASMLAPSARERLAVHADPVTVCGDRRQLFRVVLNLLDNAVRHGGEGPIEVSVTAEGGWAHLRVRDHGPGVPRRDRERIFERWGRVEGGRRGGSTGLGLFISRGIAHGHRGALECEDPPEGEGVTFRLTLPLPGGSPVVPPGRGGPGGE